MDLTICLYKQEKYLTAYQILNNLHQNKLYTTDCRDGGDYRKELDLRDNENHAFRFIGHGMNAIVKDITDLHCQDFLYSGRDYFWTADVDR